MIKDQSPQKRERTRKLRADWQLERVFNGRVYAYKDELPTDQAKTRAKRWRDRGIFVRLLPGDTKGFTRTYYRLAAKKSKYG